MQERLKEQVVTVYDPNDADTPKLKFKTAEQLDKRQRRAERILSFDDPDNPDEPINIHLRALTPNEELILDRVNLTKDDLMPLVDAIMKKEKSGEEIDTSDVVDVLAKKLVDTSTPDSERYYRRIQMGIVKPTGVTIEWLKRRNPNMLEILNSTLDDLALENDFYSLRSANIEQADVEIANLRINKED